MWSERRLGAFQSSNDDDEYGYGYEYDDDESGHGRRGGPTLWSTWIVQARVTPRKQQPASTRTSSRNHQRIRPTTDDDPAP